MGDTNLEWLIKLVDIANSTAENGHNVSSHRILSSRLRNNILETVTLGATRRASNGRFHLPLYSFFLRRLPTAQDRAVEGAVAFLPRNENG